MLVGPQHMHCELHYVLYPPHSCWYEAMQLRFHFWAGEKGHRRPNMAENKGAPFTIGDRHIICL